MEGPQGFRVRGDYNEMLKVKQPGREAMKGDNDSVPSDTIDIGTRRFYNSPFELSPEAAM